MACTTLFIGLAGGSGAGKTTLARAYRRLDPSRIGILHLDDYQRGEDEVPWLNGMRNWDHPDAIDFAALVRDMDALARGETLERLTWSEEGRTERDITPRRSTLVEPRDTMVVEGYMALWHPEVRRRCAVRIFLDAPTDARLHRRVWKKNDRYNREVLLPMHEAHVEPTRRFATHDVIDTAALDEDAVLRQFLAALGR